MEAANMLRPLYRQQLEVSFAFFSEITLCPKCRIPLSRFQCAEFGSLGQYRGVIACATH